jgi:hypothetical protein
MKIDDLVKPVGLAAALAVAAGAGLAMGLALARNPKMGVQLARTAARGLERLQYAVAETREELADFWAEAREEAREEIEERAFARGAGHAAAGAAAGAGTAAGAKHRERAADAEGRDEAPGHEPRAGAGEDVAKETSHAAALQRDGDAGEAPSRRRTRSPRHGSGD